jgi:spore coat protein U-like protein
MGRDGRYRAGSRLAALIAELRHRAHLAGCAAVAVALSAPLPAFAQTTVNSTMGVSSTVQATCLNTITPMAFGVYTGAVAASTATVTITCTNTTPYPYNVGLSAGLFPGAGVATRELTGTGGAGLNYILTSDPSYATNWGLTVGTDTVAGVGTGAAQPLTIYGQEAAGQYVAPGAYTDTVTATVTY